MLGSQFPETPVWEYYQRVAITESLRRERSLDELKDPADLLSYLRPFLQLILPSLYKARGLVNVEELLNVLNQESHERHCSFSIGNVKLRK